MSAESTTAGTGVRYERIRGMIARDECVILDGAMGTELIKVSGDDRAESEQLWGLTALLNAPEDVARVHRSYIDVGCDVVCTNTWGLPTALRDGGVEGRLGRAGRLRPGALDGPDAPGGGDCARGGRVGRAGG